MTSSAPLDEEVGRYQVQASLVANACGEGHPAPPMLNFVVDLGHLPGSTRGYWKLPDGPQVDGTLERGAEFRFEQANQIVVIPRDTTMNVPGCVIERRELVTGRLRALVVEGPDGGVNDAGPPDAGTDAGAADASAPDADAPDPSAPDPSAPDAGLSEDLESAFSGTTTVTVSAVPGGNCTALLAVYGGPFPTVPCDIEYALSGVRVATP